MHNINYLSNSILGIIKRRRVLTKFRYILAAIAASTFTILIVQFNLEETNIHLLQRFKNKLNIGNERGSIKVDIWHGFCSLNFNSLRQYALFPWQPNEKLDLKVGATLNLKNDGKSMFALRTMGYLHPPLSGAYTFRIQSQAMTQLWMQTSCHANPSFDLTKIAYTTSNSIYKRKINIGKAVPESPSITLHHGDRCYFEIWLALNDPLPKEHTLATIQWKLPNERNFTDIDGQFVSSSYTNGHQTHPKRENNTVPLASSLTFSETEDQLTGPFFPLEKNHTTVYKRVDVDINKARAVLNCSSRSLTFAEMEVLPFFDRGLLDKSFSKCLYEPSYMKKRKYARYQAVWKIRYPDLYPYDGSWTVRWGAPYKKEFNIDDRFEGAVFMKDDEAIDVVQKFMEKLNEQYPGQLQLVDITNIERVSDPGHGDRFFLELIIQFRGTSALLRVSEFFYLKSKAPSLCILENLRWERKAWINVILNVKNQAPWILNFIFEMARVLKASKDEHINFIVADYGNNGIDIAHEMTRHGIKNHKVFKRTGPFYKTSTINMAASKVTDPNSIVLLMDLHLQFPLNFFEKIRQHTIQGKLAFSPIVFRLDRCGRPQTKYLTSSGFWESLGVGIFSIYKSDWDKFGGMNEKEFKDKWGGEDWEMVDRVLSEGIEVDKLRTQGFYHFYHDKKGMWNK